MPIRTEQDNFKNNTSLSEQFSKTFSSSVQEVNSATDGFLKSSPTSVGAL